MNIQKILRKYGITSLYHFTDRSNLQSIKKYGLQSLENIAQNNISVSHFGANRLSHSLDRVMGLDKFVHLSFIQDHPMYHIAKSRGGIVDPVWLEIDISVLFKKKTRICDSVANGYDANIFNVHGITDFINLDAMVYSRDFNIRKEARKAEILVSNKITIDKIIGVHNGN
jgi:hypothetical protein